MTFMQMLSYCVDSSTSLRFAQNDKFDTLYAVTIILFSADSLFCFFIIPREAGFAASERADRNIFPAIAGEVRVPIGLPDLSQLLL